ncbi:uncharacterized protein B0H18DRAFT_954837 [Fomitopsis serialis]|uniref:uncharacterized protein n=1 Tax=Fomitopsis serialis TaxID=139415 RepID=UPI002007A9C9|nr:uncharacterized protein B0H18DRAFT_954837 [Neoantrodia serialis]KAH9926182.1 hypothetical protein B0H18DRAFT_954837 [Neoantrodia serialis]
MSHYSAYDEAREAARPFLPLTPPPEATLGLNTSALLESVDSKLNELTDERYHISRRICTLKRLRNSVALVHRLPPEMLIEIFLLVTEDKSQLEHEHKPVLDMTHVCAHWRTVALAASRLWTHIPFLPLDLAKLFLARSKNMCVKYWIYELPALSFERAKLRDRLPLQRLQSLRVSLLEPDDMEDFLDVLTEPAPNLTVLCLQPGDGPFPDPDNRLEDVTRDTLFADATPKIRTVELTSFNIHWTSGIFNNLTQLKLRDQDGRVPPPDVFLDVLESWREEFRNIRPRVRGL